MPKKSTAKGPSQWFTGAVWMNVIAKGEEPSRVRVSAVLFRHAHNAWHSDVLGQTLYVIEGEGRLQSRGQDVVEIRAGDDVVYTRPTRSIGMAQLLTTL
jgi:quercetin dioxygenase-like cupin family protein